MDRTDPRERVALHHREGSGVVRIGYPICIRTTTVLRRVQVTSHVVRVTVGGPGLDGFHSYQADDHFKIVFPDPDGVLRLPVQDAELSLDWPHPSPASRRYTVRRLDAGAREMDIDVVVHEGGVGSAWAVSAAPGDTVAIAGPPGAKAFPHTYGHYVFAVDLTAVPAVARWLEESPADVSAQVVIETDDAADHAYPLAYREGVEVTWLVRSGTRSSLAETVRALTLPDTPTFLYAAGEADDIKPLRAWSKGRLDSLFTGYWKRGVADLED
ncbi:NADPH-dependent ferric siderophore reductase [Actinocorallia herbida]|uniref:NADPH-dependent ferric siderophore reductase n=1 Tax=Actinocorallia herbida TaxID=58109 RepID=A0A3N1CY17_9ACTN|nr:siderophore-interacting protein [Actinocorallia herbida]ROO86174.1 NADPH-dependent ferric siderophore reductase [Actinocorallia herbida]